MITISHLNKTFYSRAGRVEALKDVSLNIEKGDIFGLIGFSGAGKSTLLRMANLLERPDSGTVTVDGKELTGMSERQLIPIRRRIGMVFQQFHLLESRTVAQNIEIPMVLAGMEASERAARREELLRFVGLVDKAEVYAGRLSGGQKQRVGIARALALTTGAIGLLGAAAMAGYVGGGGIGDLALTYGYQKFNTPLILFTVCILILVVQILQALGNRVSRRLRESIPPRTPVWMRSKRAQRSLCQMTPPTPPEHMSCFRRQDGSG